jgi:hypothetical protein
MGEGVLVPLTESTEPGQFRMAIAVGRDWLDTLADPKSVVYERSGIDVAGSHPFRILPSLVSFDTRVAIPGFSAGID